MDVVDQISLVPTGAKGPFKENAPLKPVIIEKIERVPPPAAVERPRRGLPRWRFSSSRICTSTRSARRSRAQFVDFLRTEARDGRRAVHPRRSVRILGRRRCAGRRPASRPSRRSAPSPRSGVPCFVMHGNRDFLLGTQFCAQSGARLLADPLIVTLYGEPVLVMHGDALCTDDRRLSATARDGAGRRLAAALSRAVGRAAPGARRRRARRQPGAHRGDRIRHRRRQCRERRARRCEAAGTATLLHGHTHRPGHSSPRRSTAAPARASCSATGTRRAACCAGTQAARSCAPCRADPQERSLAGRARVKPEHRVAAHDELRLELGERLDARAPRRCPPSPRARRASSR